MKEAKLCLLGNILVGKTSIVQRFVSDTFVDKYTTTVGAAFRSKSFDIDGEQIQFQIWDTAGQERYRSMMPLYYRRSAAAIVVYDTTSEESFRYMKNWVKELNKFGPKNIILAVAGNKLDLKEERKISYNEGKLYAEEINAIFMETSAKTGENVQDLFIRIARALPAESVEQQSQAIPVKNMDKSCKGYRSCCK